MTVWIILGIGLAIAAIGLLLLVVRRGERDEEVDEAAPPPSREHLFQKRQRLLGLFSKALTGQCEIYASDLMSTLVQGISPGISIASARRKMSKLGLRHLLVLDPQQRLVGILSDRDFAQRKGRTVADIMTSELLTITPDTPISPAVTALLNHHISCLPVVQDGKVVGIMTTTDLLLSLQCVLQAAERSPLEAEPAGA